MPNLSGLLSRRREVPELDQEVKARVAARLATLRDPRGPFGADPEPNEEEGEASVVAGEGSVHAAVAVADRPGDDADRPAVEALEVEAPAVEAPAVEAPAVEAPPLMTADLATADEPTIDAANHIAADPELEPAAGRVDFEPLRLRLEGLEPELNAQEEPLLVFAAPELVPIAIETSTTDMPTPDMPTTDLPTADLPTTDVPTPDLPTTSAPALAVSLAQDIEAGETEPSSAAPAAPARLGVIARLRRGSRSKRTLAAVGPGTPPDDATALRSAAVPEPEGPLPTTASVPPAVPVAPSREPAGLAPTSTAIAATCPYCATVLQPAPVASGRCPRCRQRIVVKRIKGRAVYLTQAALPVFEAERRRAVNAPRWTRDRDRWLALAAVVHTPADRMERIRRQPLSDEVVAAARATYLGTVDRAVRSARQERRWDEAARLRFEQAAAMYRLAGSREPMPEDALAFHREGLATLLRGIGEIARSAELASGNCCDICRADDGRSIRVSSEIREPSLPHLACPKGPCKCRWVLAERDRTIVSDLLRHQSRGPRRRG